MRRRELRITFDEGEGEKAPVYVRTSKTGIGELPLAFLERGGVLVWSPDENSLLGEPDTGWNLLAQEHWIVGALELHLVDSEEGALQRLPSIAPGDTSPPVLAPRATFAVAKVAGSATHISGERERVQELEQERQTRVFSPAPTAPHSVEAPGRLATLSRPRKILLVLVPCALAFAFLAPRFRAQQVGPAAKAAVRGDSSGSPAALSAPAVTYRAPLAPPPSMASPARVVNSARPNEPTRLGGGALPIPPRTEERTVVDAVASGASADAAVLYGELARQHPDRPEFAEAQRILRTRPQGTPGVQSHPSESPK